MFKWLFGDKLKKAAEADILEARSALATLRLKLHKEGADATRVYGEGVGEVAGLLAKRFNVSVPTALTGRGLHWQQLDDAYRDLLASVEQARAHLRSEFQTARAMAHKQVAGGLVMLHLYRMRFLAEHAPQEQQAAAAAIAEEYAQFSQILAEIAVGLREPEDAY